MEVFHLGMVGLGVMGKNLLLNMADHGYRVAGYDKDAVKAKALALESENAVGYSDLPAFISSLSVPRAIILLVPAGSPVDKAIAELTPYLSKGDLIIDAGNSHFSDTNRRVEELRPSGIYFFGMGVSGGEEGARTGPSMMPGGNAEAYQIVKPVFESIAASFAGEPCVTYVGNGSAGHFVKMVHNGIEYALMQIIAETYDVLRSGIGLTPEQIHDCFKRWNEGRLRSFLMEITKDIFTVFEGDQLLVNLIRDEARSKGTGKWTSQVAMDLQVPIPTIDVAVSMRDLSKYKAIREEASASYSSSIDTLKDDTDLLASVEEALFFSTIIAYAQGMHLLSKASLEFDYGLNLGSIARIWCGGCIIRSAFLDDIKEAYEQNSELPHLLLDHGIAEKVQSSQKGIRKLVSLAASHGIGIPAHSASLAYFDSMRNNRLPSNLLQAQRDYFGAHTYERIDKEGVFHTDWKKEVRK